MPASRTMATGARFCPSSSSIVLSNGALGVRAGVDEDGLAARLVERGQALGLVGHAIEVGGGLGDLAAERLVLHAVDEPAHDAVLEPLVAKVGAQRLVDALRRSGRASPMRVSTARASSSAPG